MDPKLSEFLNGLQIAVALAACDFASANLHRAGLDFGFADALTKRIILTVLGKIQAALIKAANDKKIAIGQVKLTFQDEPEELKTGWN